MAGDEEVTVGSDADRTEVRHLHAVGLTGVGEPLRRAGGGRGLARRGEALARAPGRVGVWLSRRCQDCGRAKPLLTAYCDACWERHEV